MNMKYIDRPFEVKAINDTGEFTGYGSVFGNVDSYKEIVAPGAFTKSLEQWKAQGKMPPILWQHRSDQPLGPYLEMAEDEKGLFIRGQLLVDDVQQAREAHALMKSKAVNGLSIGFIPKTETYNRDTGITTLEEIDLWEVSVVTFPANPAAQISSVKSHVEEIETLRDAERFLRDSGFTRSGAVAFIARVKELNQSDSDVEQIVAAAKAAMCFYK